MVGIIVISESRACVEMLKTVQTIVGKKATTGIVPLVIKSNFTKRTLTSKINGIIKKIHADDGVLIMNEIYGSTQSNVCLDFLHADQVEMICGYNLPILLKAAMLHDHAVLGDLVEQLQVTGKKYIRCFK